MPQNRWTVQRKFLFGITTIEPGTYSHLDEKSQTIRLPGAPEKSKYSLQV